MLEYFKLNSRSHGHIFAQLTTEVFVIVLLSVDHLDTFLLVRAKGCEGTVVPNDAHHLDTEHGVTPSYHVIYERTKTYEDVEKLRSG